MRKPLFAVGTTYWRSYALFDAGVRREREGDVHGAESLYVDALKLDPRNRGARMNLAILLLAGNNKQRGIEQLNKAMQEAEEANEDDDPVRYAAALRLAATHYDLKQPEKALAIALELQTHVDRKLAELEVHTGPKMNKWLAFLRAIPKIGARIAGRWEAWHLERRRRAIPHPPLKKMLQAMQPPLAVMIAGIRAASGEASALEDLERNASVDRTAPSSLVQYNLACTYAVAAGTLGETYLDRALSHLEFAQRLQARHPQVIDADHSLDLLREKRGNEYERIRDQYKPRRPRGARAINAQTSEPVPPSPSG